MKAWRTPRNWTGRWVTRPTTPAPATSRRIKSASASRAIIARSWATAPRRALSLPWDMTMKASRPPSGPSSTEASSRATRPRASRLDSLIGAIDNGVLIDGRGSYSIDQQRYNIQFGGDAFWEIKGGRKRGMISRVSYQSRTPDFWQACDGTAGPAYWRQYGTTGDAKGEPTQINSISHGCSPTRFRGINVILTD